MADSVYTTIQKRSPELMLIPDIFESWMSRPVVPNPYCSEVEVEAIEAICQLCGYTESQRLRMRKVEIPFFASLIVPDADKTKLRTVMDWIAWVYVFDDQLDDTSLGKAKEQAAEYVDRMLSVLDDDGWSVSMSGKQPLAQILKGIWDRVRTDKDCTTDTKVRWVEYMRDYLTALKVAVEFKPSINTEETIRCYLNNRFDTLGVLPLFTFIEYTCNLEIPSKVLKTSSMITLQRVGVEIQILANDSVSYHREKAQGCRHNLVFLLCHHGFSEQEAYDKIQQLIRNRYREWYIALAEMPIWGEKVDREVQRYIKGIQDVALANAHWSFRTARYFGKDRERIRVTRQVTSGNVDWLPSAVVPEEHGEIVEILN